LEILGSPGWQPQRDDLLGPNKTQIESVKWCCCWVLVLENLKKLSVEMMESLISSNFPSEMIKLIKLIKMMNGNHGISETSFNTRSDAKKSLTNRSAAAIREKRWRASRVSFSRTVQRCAVWAMA
jgi:hypothetical protein